MSAEKIDGTQRSAELLRQLGQQKRPGSGRQERDRQRSNEQASSSERCEDIFLPRSNGSAKCLSPSAARRSADGAPGLMPIVQRSALESGAAKPYNRPVYSPIAAAPENGADRSFRRRLGSNKSSPGSTYDPQRRFRHSVVPDAAETDSPKGLDRALTPSMLKAVRGARTPDSSRLSSSRTGRATDFQSSFSQCLGSSNRATGISYENLTASFTEGLVPSPNASKIRRPEFARSWTGGASGGNTRARSSWDGGLQDGDARKDQPQLQSPFLAAAGTGWGVSPPTSARIGSLTSENSQQVEREAPNSQGSTKTALIADDHVAQMLGRKSLSISTSRPLTHLIADASQAFSIHPSMSLKKGRKLVRCNITRINRRSLLGFSKPAIFELYSMKGRLKLVGERDGGSQISFSIYTPGDQGEKRTLAASLISSTFVENQFLLMGTDPASPAAACDPDQDPVIMAVAFGRSISGLRTVTALLPDNKASSAGSNDLGSKQHVSSYFTRLSEGDSLKNIKVLRSITGKELHGARFARGSVKNVQLQVVDCGAEWPGETPKLSSADSISASFGGGKAEKESSTTAPPVFEFGRLRHQHEFVCDYESPLLTAVQALGLSIACSAPKRAFLYI